MQRTFIRHFLLAAVLLVNLRDLSLYGFLSDEARAALDGALELVSKVA